MPPFWSLGFHLCRYGYESIENLRKVIQVKHPKTWIFFCSVFTDFRFILANARR